ncbi:MAG: general stress protein [Anaerolineae bacterium]
MSEQSVVGVYRTMSEAEEAVRVLDRGGFPIKQVSVLAQNLESEKAVHGYVTAGDVAKAGAGTGAWVGGLFGLLVGAAFIWVPGFGPLLVAGPFAAMLLGGVEGVMAGAASGGLLGALVGWGVSKQHILKYEEHLKGGKYLVIAHGSAEEVARAQNILQGTAAIEVTQHGAAAA